MKFSSLLSNLSEQDELNILVERSINAYNLGIQKLLKSYEDETKSFIFGLSSNTDFRKNIKKLEEGFSDIKEVSKLIVERKKKGSDISELLEYLKDDVLFFEREVKKIR